MFDVNEYIAKIKAELAKDSENPLEGMNEFFTARIDSYESHMHGLFKDTYVAFVDHLPKQTQKLLDLGCGTGLELDEIFQLFPKVRVTGIDINDTMLEILKKKHSDKNLTLIRGDFLAVSFGRDAFDAAISFEALHHFTAEQKQGIYQRIYTSVKNGGCYLEFDYIAESMEEAELYFADREKRRAAEALPENALIHYDTPLTEQQQISLLKDAGFSEVACVHRDEANIMLRAEKW